MRPNYRIALGVALLVGSALVVAACGGGSHGAPVQMPVIKHWTVLDATPRSTPWKP
jgi:hypothetical protein